MEQKKLVNRELKNLEVKKSEIEEVKDTPFTLVKNGELFYISVGLHICSDRTFTTKKEALRYINSKPWNLIVLASHLVSKKLSQSMDLPVKDGGAQ